MRLGEAALAQLKQAESEMRAERESRVEDGIAAKCAEFAHMDLVHSDEFARYAVRCDVLRDTLPTAEIAREQAAIVDDARRGARDAAAERVRELERRADLAHATTVSQRLVTDEILGRAGVRFAEQAKDGNTVKGKLDLGGGHQMPMVLVSAPPSGDGGPTEHEVVFQNANSNIPSCPDQEEAVRQMARKAGSEVNLDDPQADAAQHPRRKRKRAKATQAKKTRRAG